MPDDRDSKNHDHRLTMFSVSAGMVGVCLTGVGLIGVVKGVRQLESTTDEVLTVSALLYLISTALYFFALRRKNQTQWTKTDIIADFCFFFGLGLLLVACGILTMGFQ